MSSQAGEVTGEFCLPEKNETPELRYRYLDRWKIGSGSEEVEVVCEVFTVLKRTEKGEWIASKELPDEPYKFILTKAKKKYAHQTKKEAWKSFNIRKERQMKILLRQLERIRKVNNIVMENRKNYENI